MKTIGLTIAAALFLAACANPGGPEGSGQFQKEGWVPFATARTGDGPGRIYRVDPSGSVYGVTDVGAKPREDNQQLYQVSGKREFTLGDVLRTIGVAQETLPLTVTGNLTATAEMSQEATAAKREYLDDEDLTETQILSALSRVKIRGDNTYYVIRETLSSKSVKFKVSNNWLTSLGVTADIKKAVQNTANAKWEDGNEVSLDAKFDVPYRVWYKPERLVIEHGLGAAPGQPPSGVRLVANAVEFKIPGGEIQRVE